MSNQLNQYLKASNYDPARLASTVPEEEWNDLVDSFWNASSSIYEAIGNEFPTTDGEQYLTWAAVGDGDAESVLKSAQLEPEGTVEVLYDYDADKGEHFGSVINMLDNLLHNPSELDFYEPSEVAEALGVEESVLEKYFSRKAFTQRLAIIEPCRQQDYDPNRPKSEQKVCLYSKKDPGKLLGRHPNEESARKQEVAIQINKGAGIMKDKKKMASTKKLAGLVSGGFAPPVVKKDGETYVPNLSDPATRKAFARFIKKHGIKKDHLELVLASQSNTLPVETKDRKVYASTQIGALKFATTKIKGFEKATHVSAVQDPENASVWMVYDHDSKTAFVTYLSEGKFEEVDYVDALRHNLN